MNHLKDDPRLTAYALGELSEQEAETFRRELERSPEAIGEAESIRAMGERLRCELGREAAGELTAGQRERLLEGLRPVTGGGRRLVQGVRGWWVWWRMAGWGLAGAAAVVLVLVGLRMNRTGVDREVAVAPAEVNPGALGGAEEQTQGRDRLTHEVVTAAGGAVESGPGPGLTEAARVVSPGLPVEVAPAGVALAPAVVSGQLAARGLPALKDPEGGDRLMSLEIRLPIPAFMGTPTDIALNEHIEKPSEKPRPPFLVPRGTRLLSLNAPVTSSDRNPVNGAAELVTDGNKEAGDSSVLELHRKLQWVQVDLGGACRLEAVLVWHAHDTPQIVKDVVVQVADDAAFTVSVRTLYNNDYDNSAGLGVGTDKEYFESYEGRLIQARGEVARHVRCYSQGSTYTALNRFTEIEVYGSVLSGQ